MFYQLTTPVQKYIFQDDIPVEDFAWLRWTFAQARMIKLEKSMPDLNFDGQAMWFKMTQAETKLFDPFLPINVQVRAVRLDGEALVFPEYIISTHDVLNGTVVEMIPA